MTPEPDLIIAVTGLVAAVTGGTAAVITAVKSGRKAQAAEAEASAARVEIDHQRAVLGNPNGYRSIVDMISRLMGQVEQVAVDGRRREAKLDDLAGRVTELEGGSPSEMSG